MITDNLGLAHQLARRFLHRGEPLEDLVQVASVALVKSVDRFDPGRGVDFAAFATRTIIGELKRHFRDKGWAVRASRRVQELYLELGHATATLIQEFGRSPTVAELAAGHRVHRRSGPRSDRGGPGLPGGVHRRIGERGRPALATAWASSTPATTRSKSGRCWPRPWPCFPKREQSILRMRFVQGLTQSEIAAAIGVSQMHVSRLLAASLEELRRHIDGRAGD